ncbi:hypothetical protein HK102_004519, partial [Quaeritorhiza haematococci]
MVTSPPTPHATTTLSHSDLPQKSTSTDFSKQPNILIVGGGPVGFYTGIQLLRKGYNNVEVINNYQSRPETYFTINRDQVVVVSNTVVHEILTKQFIYGCWSLHPNVALSLNCLDPRKYILEERRTPSDFPREFVRTYTLSDLEYGLAEAFEQLGGRRTDIGFRRAAAQGKVSRADVVICADWACACRDQLIGIQPQRVFDSNNPRGNSLGPEELNLDPTDLSPKAYGAICIIRSKYIPEAMQNFKFRFHVQAPLPTPQHRFEATLGMVEGADSWDKFIYLGMQLTKEEYENVSTGRSRNLLNSDIIRERIVDALKHYNFDVLRLPDIALSHSQVTAFEINLRHQPKDGFATVSTIDQVTAGGLQKQQLRFVVGDAAAS